MHALLLHRIRQTLALVLLSLGSIQAAPTTTLDPRAEYKALLALSQAKPPETTKSDEAAKIAWLRQRHDELYARGPAFLEQFATNPLRWDTLVLLRYGGETRERILRDGFRQLIPVPESLEAWEVQYFPKLEALLAARDSSPSARSEAFRQLIDYTYRRALRLPTEAPAAIPRVRAWLDQFDREFPRSSYVPYLYNGYATLLDATDPSACVAFLAELERRYPGSEFLDQRVREIAAGRRRSLEAQARPVTELWARLRELDPVAGDSARYRGKVVLIGFGAVSYASLGHSLEDYHAQFGAAGLAILQVAQFDSAVGLPPEPQQRRDMEKIVAIRKWPWPVLWNPGGFSQSIPAKWGLTTYPAWMLIGRDGLIAIDRTNPLTVTIARELARPVPDKP